MWCGTISGTAAPSAVKSCEFNSSYLRFSGCTIDFKLKGKEGIEREGGREACWGQNCSVGACGIYGGINVVISWKEAEEGGREGGKEEKVSCSVRSVVASVAREARGRGRGGKGGILAEVSLPLPIYCLWLFCDEIESRSSSPASSSCLTTGSHKTLGNRFWENGTKY